MPRNPILAAAIDNWRSRPLVDGADTDDAPEIDRRDAEGDVPPSFVGTDPGPFDTQDPEPPAAPPAILEVELVAPVEIAPARDWQIGTITVGTDPVQIATADPSRLTLSVTNRGTPDLRVATRRENLSGPSTRGTIHTNETRTWGHVAEIWAVCATSSAAVEITSERR